MSLDELCHQTPSYFCEIVLAYSPGKKQIQPFIPQLPGRLLTLPEWMAIANLVWEWYEHGAPASIEARNAEWEQSCSAMILASATRPKTPSCSGWIYVLEGNGYYKIGKAVELERRIMQFAPSLPFPVRKVYSFQTESMNRDERILHLQFADKRVNGEWFKLDNADLEWIKEYGRQD